MASVVLTAAGQSAAPGVGGLLLGTLGRAAGGLADRQIFGTRKFEGPRLDNLQVQDSRYGAAIPIVYGHARVAGHIIWSSNLIETRHEQSVGGKGGTGSSSSASQVTYTYSVNCAVLIAEGPIQGLTAVWADGKLIFDGKNWSEGLASHISVYTGTPTQSADSVMEAALGAGNVPAYRNLAYVVFENLQLASFGNRLPNITFGVQASASSQAPAWLGRTTVAKTNALDALSHPGATMPIITQGRTSYAREILVFAIQQSGTTATLQALYYDMSGSTPVLAQTVSAANFTSTDPVQDVVWAASPDLRYVAVLVQNAAASPDIAHVFLYDLSQRTFGTRLQISLKLGRKGLVWLSPTDVMMADQQSNALGARWLSRSGNTWVDRGFINVWGINSALTRFTIAHQNFLPVAGGYVMLAYNATNNPNTVYGCFIAKLGASLSSGSPFTISSAIPASAGDEPIFLPLDDNEWLMTMAGTLDVEAMSFALASGSASMTRNWQSLSLGGTSTLMMPCALTSTRVGILQKRSSETSYRWAEVELTAASFSIAQTATTVTSYTSAAGAFLPFRVDAQKIGVLGGTSGSVFDHIGMFYRQGVSGASLGSVVSNVLARAGYSGGEYDVSALNALGVDGYVLQGPLTPRQALEPLQLHSSFDVVESGQILRTQLRGYASALTVPESSLRAAPVSDDVPAALQRLFSPTHELPDEVVIDYLDPARDYTVGSQRARRAQSISNKVDQRSLPMVASAAQAKQIAARELLAIWAERDEVTFFLPRQYAKLEPGDVISISGLTLRLQRIRLRNGVLEIRALRIAAAPSGVHPVADSGDYSYAHNTRPLVTQLDLMNLPPLRSGDDTAGFYFAMSGAAGWPGGSVYRAKDGVNFSLMQSVQASATAGYSTTTLPSASAFYMDRAHTVRVQLQQGSLSSVTEDALLNGANVALLGDEIFQFQQAALLGDGYYELSLLLRGLRGTEDAMASHSVGERFVLLNEQTIRFQPCELSEAGLSYAYQALATGQNLGDVQTLSFIATARTLVPLAPVHLRGARASGTGSDLTLSWVRRNRLDFSWRDGVDVALDESGEQYVVQIMNGISIIREFSPTANSQIYTSAQQSADWGTVPSTFTVRVAQISARVGAGNYAEAVI